MYYEIMRKATYNYRKSFSFEVPAGLKTNIKVSIIAEEFALEFALLFYKFINNMVLTSNGIKYKIL